MFLPACRSTCPCGEANKSLWGLQCSAIVDRHRTCASRPLLVRRRLGSLIRWWRVRWCLLSAFCLFRSKRTVWLFVNLDKMHYAQVRKCQKLDQLGSLKRLFVAVVHHTWPRILVTAVEIRVCASCICRKSPLFHTCRCCGVRCYLAGRSNVVACVGDGRNWLIVYDIDKEGKRLRHLARRRLINFIVNNVKGRWARYCDSLMFC